MNKRFGLPSKGLGFRVTIMGIDKGYIGITGKTTEKFVK